MDRHGAGRRHGPGRHRHRRPRHPRGLPQRPLRHPGVLAAGHRRTRAGLAAHHLRRTRPGQEVGALGRLLLRGGRPGRRRRARGPGRGPGAGGGLVLRGLRRGPLGEPQSGPRPGRGPGGRRAAVRLAHRGDGAGDPPVLRTDGPAHAPAAPDGPHPADDRRTDGEQQHRGRPARPRARTGPRTGRHHRPGAASGRSFGSKGDEQERIRAGLDPVFRRKPNIRLSAKVPSNHGAILRKDAPAVATAVREAAALADGAR